MKLIKFILNIFSAYTYLILIEWLIRCFSRITLELFSISLKMIYDILLIPIKFINGYLNIFHLALPIFILGLANIIYNFLKPKK